MLSTGAWGHSSTMQEMEKGLSIDAGGGGQREEGGGQGVWSGSTLRVPGWVLHCGSLGAPAIAAIPRLCGPWPGSPGVWGVTVDPRI